jgi:hypothetical protein
MKRATVASKISNEDSQKRIRDSAKDLSTSEIQFRLTISRNNLANLEADMSEATIALNESRKVIKTTREIIAGLEQLLEARR